MTVRGYQRRAIDAAFREWRKGVRSTLFVCPTGGGKSFVFCRIAARFRPKGRILILADRDLLVRQARGNIQRHTKLSVGVEMGAEKVNRKRLPDVVCASVQSMTRRLPDFASGAFKLVVIDEADLAAAPSYRRVLDRFSRARVFGVTATPDRQDGVALGSVFDSVCSTVDIRDLIRQGHLSPIRQRAVRVLDLSRVKVAGDDFVEASLDRILSEERHLHEVVKPTLAVAKQRPTLVFAASVAHARKLAAVFNRYRAGCARSIDGSLNESERKAVIEPFQRGEVQFVTCCDLLTRGIDLPLVSCVAVARPTQSRAKYVQMLGRGTRLYPGKSDLLVLDFTDNADTHSVVSVIEALGGKEAPEVQERAKELLDEEPEQLVDAVLTQARQQLDHDAELRARVLAKVRFKTRWARKEIDWAKQSWGKLTDQQIASALDVSRRTVACHRARLGIPSMRASWPAFSAIDWDAQPWDRMSDSAMAGRLGVSPSFVNKERRRRGIRPFHRIDWEAQGLGEKPDEVIAARLGVHKATVWQQRRRRGIPKFLVPVVTRWDRVAHLMGTMPDVKIAQMVGTSIESVRHQREKRGIPAFFTRRNAERFAELGKVPDMTLARRFGVSYQAVRQARERRGIPPFRPLA